MCMCLESCVCSISKFLVCMNDLRVLKLLRRTACDIMLGMTENKFFLATIHTLKVYRNWLKVRIVLCWLKAK